jgi:hypothetical protein
MPLIIPDFSPPKSAEDELLERVAWVLKERLEGEWDVVGDDRLMVCRELAGLAIGAMRLGIVSGSSLGRRAEQIAPKGGIMLPGAGTVALWNAMIDAILKDV